MRYLILLAADEALDPQPGTPEFDADMAGYARFDELAGSAIVAGEALWPAAAATTVRPSPGGPIVTDGPFAETTEVVGGWYVLDADDLDEAIELVRHLPAARYGAAEIRPFAGWVDGVAVDGEVGSEEAPRHVAFIWHDDANRPQPGDPVLEQIGAAHRAFQAEHAEHLRGAGALMPATTATTVRVRDEEVLVTDGPYAETGEVIGGLYLLGPATPSATADLAGRIPVPPGGVVELRPIVEMV